MSQHIVICWLHEKVEGHASNRVADTFGPFDSVDDADKFIVDQPCDSVHTIHRLVEVNE